MLPWGGVPGMPNGRDAPWADAGTRWRDYDYETIKLRVPLKKIVDVRERGRFGFPC